MQANNTFHIVGRLTRDAEGKTAGESYRAFLSVACDRMPKRDAEGKTLRDEKGYPVRDTDFINVVVWGNMAENAAKNLGKGSLIAISGSIRTSRVAREDGKADFYTDLRADDIRYELVKKPEGAANGAEGATPPVSGEAPAEEF